MTLTLAIPAHNDADDLARLLARAAAIGCFDHIVVVDDGSDTPLGRDHLCAASGLDPARLTLLRHETARGPGAARNRALAEVDTDHVLFMDADDLPTRELAHLVADLGGQAFDFCAFQHHDTRSEQEHRWGQTPWDQALWRAAGVDLGALSAVPAGGGAALAQTANYPWNKLYRTAFLRENAIACSDILVHEDVELHWHSFLNARTILASDRIGVVHFVSPGGGRLTNRAGPERLEVFGPLSRISAEIETGGHDVYALPFFRFALGLIDWISGNLRAEYRERLGAMARAFVITDMPISMLERLRHSDAALVARIEALIRTDPAPT